MALCRRSENWTDDDEAAFATRILRAGGAVLGVSCAQGEGLNDACDKEWRVFDQWRKYVFGWPDDGGVWVLSMYLRIAAENGTEDLVVMDPDELIEMLDVGLAELNVIPDGVVDLRDHDSMGGYFATLAELGAIFSGVTKNALK